MTALMVRPFGRQHERCWLPTRIFTTSWQVNTQIWRRPALTSLVRMLLRNLTPQGQQAMSYCSHSVSSHAVSCFAHTQEHMMMSFSFSSLCSKNDIIVRFLTHARARKQVLRNYCCQYFERCSRSHKKRNFFRKMYWEIGVPQRWKNLFEIAQHDGVQRTCMLEV